MFQGKSEQCPFCASETETTEHFLLDFSEYDAIKSQFSFYQEQENFEKKMNSYVTYWPLTNYQHMKLKPGKKL